jgi:hypothetical protein
MVSPLNTRATWWMRIFQQNILNGVAKSVMSRIRIFYANAPTALPLKYAAVVETGSLIRSLQTPGWDTSDPNSPLELPDYRGTTFNAITR